MNDDHVGRDIATRYVTGENDETKLELRELVYPAKCEFCNASLKKGVDALGVHPGQARNMGTKWIWFCLPCVNDLTTADSVRAVEVKVVDLFKKRSTPAEEPETNASSLTQSELDEVNPFLKPRPESEDDSG